MCRLFSYIARAALWCLGTVEIGEARKVESQQGFFVHHVVGRSTVGVAIFESSHACKATAQSTLWFSAAIENPPLVLVSKDTAADGAIDQMVDGPRLVSSVQRLKRAEDAGTIEFVGDVANVEVPVEILDALPLKNADRSDGPRLRAVLRSIRRGGYDNFEPIRASREPAG